MTVEDILQKYGFTKKGLSERFGIPYRTIQNWTSNTPSYRRECPEYVINMMEEILNRELHISER